MDNGSIVYGSYSKGYGEAGASTRKRALKGFNAMSGSPREDIDYNNVQGIRIEARQKLEKFRPASIGQASRISGVSPADINVLLIYLNLENNK